jgi:GTP cyclohydrolase I
MSCNLISEEFFQLDKDEMILKTPVSKDIPELSQCEKIGRIAHHFSEIMQILGLNVEEESLSGTPKRVAKMYVNEHFSGLSPLNKPRISLFENNFGYKKMLVEKDITMYSHCEHHFVPFFGKVHVAYIPGKHIIGLSKINRLVQYYARRPQVQERLTIEIAEAMKNVLKHSDVAVAIEADHLCVASRGIQDTSSRTFTAFYSGQFEKEDIRTEFLFHIRNK